ncbi:hypothetical protein GCM10010912_00110 [Paenibacillus albidus]|uniref:Uncharacterized protein n=1 Tax=Paenibacillus albidus TaxID=2041023 RepID=A0A917BU84_9BACL|nr:hypothetical protein GCM10010912_00110 [Paenibacillus albidus]
MTNILKKTIPKICFDPFLTIWKNLKKLYKQKITIKETIPVLAEEIILASNKKHILKIQYLSDFIFVLSTKKTIKAPEDKNNEKKLKSVKRNEYEFLLPLDNSKFPSITPNKFLLMY